MKWRVESPGRFYDVGESTVVYFDIHSGDTHLLTDFAAFVLTLFEGRALDVAELANLATDAVDSADRQDLETSVSSVLEELAKLDILKQS